MGQREIRGIIRAGGLPQLINPPRSKDSSVFTPWFVGFISIISSHIFLVLLFIFYYYLRFAELAKAQTMVFVSMILLEMFNVFNCRSQKYSIRKKGPLQNRWLVVAVAASLALCVMVIHIPFMNILFHTKALGLRDWFIAFFASSTIVLVVECVKWIRKRYV